MAGRSNTISTSEPRLGGIQVQTSLYGLALPMVWGRVRIGGNLLWYGDFTATPHTEVSNSGGKGGGAKQSSTRYTYTAAVALGICAGPVNGILTAWKGKDRLIGASAGTRTRTLVEAFTVPGGGVVTVAQAASLTFNVAARHADNLLPGMRVLADGAAAGGVLVEGVDYTRSGGVYTFVAAWVGDHIEIEYQISEAVAANSVLGQLGLNLATGTLGQPVWAHLSTNHPSEAIGYSGLAYLYAPAYSLNDSAQVENHNFEVSTPSEFSSSIPDADMARVVQEFLTDGLHGALWPAAYLASLADYSDYCVSHGLFMSPELTEQRSAADVLKNWLTLTNSNVVWSGRQLKVVPLGDEARTANGATYTPDTTPVYDLTVDDFVTEGERPRIKIKPRANEDAFNHIRVEFKNRASGYALEIATAKDQAHIELYGERVMDVIQAHECKTAAVAGFVAQMALQRQMAVWNDYTFTVGWMKGLLEPLDLLTLTDEQLYLDRTPVRITKVSEAGSDAFEIEAEDAPIGMASAPLYGMQAGSGFMPDYNAAPGAALTPVIFEAPGALTVNGLEVWVAATGTGANWGGCRVWVSLDGSNYREIAVLVGGSRYGTLSANIGASGSVPVLLNKGQLLAGSSADAAALNTLCFIKGATQEFIAYETATLTGALAYTLGGGMARGAYGTAAAAHTSGDAFVRIDDAVARSGPIDLGYVGKTIHVKLTSFNVYGGAEEALAGATDYTYTITGARLYGNAGAAALLGVSNASSDNLLTAGEKPPIVLEYTKATGEQTGIDAQATAYAITTEKTAYDNALSALTTYLGTLTSAVAWNVLTGDTTIVGTTFRSTWATFYAARQALLNKIDALAGTLATWAGVSGVAVATGQVVANAITEQLGATAAGPVSALSAATEVQRITLGPYAFAVEVVVQFTGQVNAQWTAAGPPLITIDTYMEDSQAGAGATKRSLSTNDFGPLSTQVSMVRKFTLPPSTTGWMRAMGNVTASGGGAVGDYLNMDMTASVYKK